MDDSPPVVWRLPGVAETDYEVRIETMAGNSYIVNVFNILWTGDSQPFGFRTNLLTGEVIPWHNVTLYQVFRPQP